MDNSSELLAKAKQTTDEEKSKELEEMSRKLEEKSKELEDKRKELDEKCKELENERRERLKLSELLKEEKKRTALLEDKVWPTCNTKKKSSHWCIWGMIQEIWLIALQ